MKKAQLTQKVKNSGLKMADEWKILQRNVSKILKHAISIKNLKHIVAVINVMESAGMDFDVRDMASPMTYSQVQYKYVQDPINFVVDHDYYNRSRRITFDISERIIHSLKPELLQNVIVQNVIDGIYRAIKEKG